MGRQLFVDIALQGQHTPWHVFVIPKILLIPILTLTKTLNMGRPYIDRPCEPSERRTLELLSSYRCGLWTLR